MLMMNMNADELRARFLDNDWRAMELQVALEDALPDDQADQLRDIVRAHAVTGELHEAWVVAAIASEFPSLAPAILAIAERINEGQ
jgi:hypothetical protein